MSARYSDPLNSDRCNPRESSPSGHTDPVREEYSCKFADLETEDHETYLECQNQQHYIEKYHAKTGQWPPGMGFSPTLPSLLTLDENSQMGESNSAMIPEGTKKPTVIGHGGSGTQTVPNTHSAAKRQRPPDDLDGESDKENTAPSTRKAKRPRKVHRAATLLQNAVRLSQQGINLSQEALGLCQAMVELLNGNN